MQRTSSTHVKTLADEVEFKIGGRDKDVMYHKEVFKRNMGAS